ncbi:MAG: glycosyltransferase family 2 protein, partial [Halobacteriaceae archaeon]
TEPELTVGTKLFTRETKLKQLLQSIPETVDRVIVADDGPVNAADRDVFNLVNDRLDLTVLNLEADAGLGAGRQAILEECGSDYLCIVDTDMEVPTNVTTLVDILDATPSLGGLSGFLRESGELTGLFHDLYETADGDLLIRDVREEKERVSTAGGDYVPFNFVPNAAVFRTECLRDYGWDTEYVIGREHLDFYLGHWKQTEWKFGVCPDVAFPHYPGGSTSYMDDRRSSLKLRASRAYFREKWGYHSVIGVDDWLGRMKGDRPLHPLPTPPMPLRWQARLKRARQSVEETLGLT